jgi:hypothetical protein
MAKKIMRSQEEFCEYIRNHERLECAVTVIFERVPQCATIDRINAVDAFVERHGCIAQGSRWRSLDRMQAISHLQDMLRASLAYREFMFSESEASEIAHAFAGFFDKDSACWFTNGTRGAWNAVTTSMFDNAMVAMDGSTIALILFEDED